jgi:hypothetical protein
MKTVQNTMITMILLILKFFISIINIHLQKYDPIIIAIFDIFVYLESLKEREWHSAT